MQIINKQFCSNQIFGINELCNIQVPAAYNDCIVEYENDIIYRLAKVISIDIIYILAAF